MSGGGHIVSSGRLGHFRASGGVSAESRRQNLGEAEPAGGRYGTASGDTRPGLPPWGIPETPTLDFCTSGTSTLGTPSWRNPQGTPHLGWTRAEALQLITGVWMPRDPRSNAASLPPAPACIPPCGERPPVSCHPCPLVHLPSPWGHQVSPCQGTSQPPASSSVPPAASWTASTPWTAQVQGHGKLRLC